MTASDIDGTNLQPGDRVECVSASKVGDFPGQPGERFTVQAADGFDAMQLEGQRRSVIPGRFRKLATPDATADGYDWPQLHRDTVTAEAEAMVYGDRGDDYGHPRDHWTRTAVLVTGLLQHKLAEGEYITPEDWGRIMVAEKLARDVHTPKRDNRTDIAGYALCLDRLETGK